MAKINKKGHFQGKIKNLVYRELKGKPIVQSAPAKVKQTLASKLAAQEFAIASNAGAILRKIGALLYEYSDGKVSSRISGLLRSCLKNVGRPMGERSMADIDPTPLIGFQFNSDAPFERCMARTIHCDVSQEGTVSLNIQALVPSNDLPFLQVTTRSEWPSLTVSLRLGLFAIDFRSAELTVLQIEDIVLYEKGQVAPSDPTDISWTCLKKLPENHLILLYGSLHYHRMDFLGNKKYIGERNYNAAALLTAFRVDGQMRVLNEALTLQDKRYLPLKGPIEFYSIEEEKFSTIKSIQQKEENKTQNKSTGLVNNRKSDTKA